MFTTINERLVQLAQHQLMWQLAKLSVRHNELETNRIWCRNYRLNGFIFVSETTAMMICFCYQLKGLSGNTAVEVMS